MRNAGLVLATLMLSACASRVPVSCQEKFNADSPSIRERVLAAHPLVQPVEVLQCVAIPTPSGFGADPDEEACLVRIAPDSIRRDADPSSRLLQTPEVVRKLAPDLPERSYAAGINEGGAAVYRTFNLELVVLYAQYARCAELEE